MWSSQHKIIIILIMLKMLIDSDTGCFLCIQSHQSIYWDRVKNNGKTQCQCGNLTYFLLFLLSGFAFTFSTVFLSLLCPAFNHTSLKLFDSETSRPPLLIMPWRFEQTSLRSWMKSQRISKHSFNMSSWQDTLKGCSDKMWPLDRPCLFVFHPTGHFVIWMDG